MPVNYGGAVLAIGGTVAAGGIVFYLLGAGALDGILASINQMIGSLSGSVGKDTDEEDEPKGNGGTNTTPDPKESTCKTGEEYDEKKKKCVKVKEGNYVRAYLTAEHKYMGDRPIYYSQGVVKDRAYLMQYY